MSESDFSVSEALNFAATFELDGCVGTPCEVAIVLAAELRRLRAGVEAVRALPTYDAELGGYTEGGPFVYRDDVLRILEASDG